MSTKFPIANHIRCFGGKAVMTTPAGLKAYTAIEPSPFGQLERLEQMRFFETGQVICIAPFAPLEGDCAVLIALSMSPRFNQFCTSAQIA